MPRCSQPRGGFSLIEMVAATVVATLLLAGAAGFLAFFARWSAEASERVEEALEVAIALERLHLELQEAVAIYVKDPRVVEFLHPDIDGDGTEDVVRWEWGGRAGDPLVRTVSSGGALVNRADASPPLNDFVLEYWVRQESTGTGPGPTAVKEYLVLVFAAAEDMHQPEPRQYRKATVLWNQVDVTGL